MIRGKFIVLEGGEGVGKTTQLQLLVDYLQKKGIITHATREPGGSVGAEALRQLLVTPEHAWDPVTETLLMTAARHDHWTRVIAPALASGTWVLCDRFVYSTLAYQGGGAGVPLPWIQMLHHLVLGRAWPCLTIILHTENPTSSLARARLRDMDRPQKFEDYGADYHARLHALWTTFAASDPHRIALISAEGTVEAVHQRIVEVVTAQFGRLFE